METPRERGKRLADSAQKAKAEGKTYDEWATIEGLPLLKEYTKHDLIHRDSWPVIYRDIYPHG